MSKPAFMKFALWSVLCICIGSLAAAFATRLQSSAVQQIPQNADEILSRSIWIAPGTHKLGSREAGCFPRRSVALAGFHIWSMEIPHAWWTVYVGENLASNRDGTLPARGVSYHDAVAFCEWLSATLGVKARLPTVDEWEAAARAGKPGMPYHWGWGSPSGRGVMNAAAPSPVDFGRPNPAGLWNMCGNVAEWCLAGDGDTEAPVMGGSWAERDARYLRISHRMLLPKDYRDHDVGFRIVIEAPAEKETVVAKVVVEE